MRIWLGRPKNSLSSVGGDGLSLVPLMRNDASALTSFVLLGLRLISKTSSFRGARSAQSFALLEVTVGIEPTNSGFADRGLTTWLRHPELLTSFEFGARPFLEQNNYHGLP